MVTNKNASCSGNIILYTRTRGVEEPLACTEGYIEGARAGYYHPRVVFHSRRDQYPETTSIGRRCWYFEGDTNNLDAPSLNIVGRRGRCPSHSAWQDNPPALHLCDYLSQKELKKTNNY